jgi:predicted acyl esterase
MRGKFHNGFENLEPCSPGVPTEAPFTIEDGYHTFRPGHRIMVQVQSRLFSSVGRNPHKFVDIYNARSSDFSKATHRVYRSPESPTRPKLLVMP